MLHIMDERKSEEEEISYSNCSSDCQSGWTTYLDHSHAVSVHQDQQKQDIHYQTQKEYEEDEEDLSMVSDASSGPPHIMHDDEDEEEHCCYDNGKKRIRVEKFIHQTGKQVDLNSSVLDDTANSLFLNFSQTSYSGSNSSKNSKKKMFAEEISSGFSASQIKGASREKAEKRI